MAELVKAKLNSTTIKQLVPQEKAFEVVDTEIKGFLLRIQPTGRMTFYFSYRNVAAQRKRIKIGVLNSDKTLAQARDDAMEFAAKVSKGVDIQSNKLVERKDAKDQLTNTLAIFLENQYKPWALTNLKSGQQTVDSVKRSFPDLLDSAMSDIKLKDIERWRTERITKGLKPSTLNRVANALRGVLTKAVEWNVIAEHPLSKLKNLKIDEGKKARYLSEPEESRLYEALSARDKELKAARDRGNQFRHQRGYPLMQDLSKFAYGDRMTPIITLALKTGMRRGELFDLRWSDIDLKTKVVTVKGENAKSSKTRHIPLSPTAIQTIQKWKKQAPIQDHTDSRVFPANEDDGRLDNLNKSWATILKSAKVKNFRWHDMRHDFASKLVMKGVPLNTVRELCGHSDLNTTLRYAHLAEDHKADAIALIG